MTAEVNPPNGPEARGPLRRIAAFLGTLPGRISALAGTIIAVAGAWAVLRGEEPTERAGDIAGVSVEQQVSLDEFRRRGTGAPRECPGFERPRIARRKSARHAGATARGPFVLAASGPDAALAQEPTSPEPPEIDTDTTGTQTETTGPQTSTDGADTTDTNVIGAKAAGKLLERKPLPPRVELAPQEADAPEAVARSVQRIEFDAAAPQVAVVEEITSRPDLSLTELDRLLERAAPALLGNVVAFVVRVRGLKGKCTYVNAALFDARRRVRLREPFAAPRDALFFIPRTPNDQTRHEVWVPRPRARGSYFVRLELFDDNAEGLNLDERARFRVPIR